MDGLEVGRCIQGETEMTTEHDAAPKDEERGQSHVPSRAPLARSSSSVSFALAVSNYGHEEE